MTFPSYSIGTASVSNGGTLVTFDGGLLTEDNAREGDLLVFPGFAPNVIKSVDYDQTDQLTIDAWQFTTRTAAAYVIFHTSNLRVEGAEQAAEITRLIRYLNGAGLFYFVEGTEPDPAVGDDGQYALKTNSGAWLLWYKIAGVWELQGSPAGVTYRGEWDSGTAYVVNDRVSRLGVSYTAKQASTNQNPTTDTGFVYWDAGGAKGDDGDVGPAGPAPDLDATSVTSNVAGTGFKGWVIGTGKDYASGMRLRIASNNGIVLLGVVDYYSAGTLYVNVDDSTGSGSATSWTIALGGERGLTGATGAAGATGPAGSAPVLNATATDSNSAGTGEKAWSVGAGKNFAAGMRLRIASASPAITLSGVVSYYVGSILSVLIDDSTGSGTSTSWTVALAGERGTAGGDGGPGATGNKGDTGATPNLSGTSITAITVALGALTLTTGTNRAFAAGMKVRVANADATKVLVGYVTSYVPATGVLQMFVQKIEGTGSASSWLVNITGEDGSAGATGSQGTGLAYNASGTLAQRSTYDGQTTGFAYLVTSTAPFQLFVKASNVSADWAGPTFIGGSAPTGDFGSIADSVLETFDYGSIAA